MSVLTPSEKNLLLWLNGEDYSQYGECHGADLDSLITQGLAQIHGPGEYQSGFIAQDHTGEKGMKYRAVSLTKLGVQLVRQIEEGNV